MQAGSRLRAARRSATVAESSDGSAEKVLRKISYRRVERSVDEQSLFPR